MISIVVCSINESFYRNLVDSIKNTIGENLVWEIVKIDNNIFKYSLSEAYNLGAKNAKFNIIVFVHEDVVFRTFDWGFELINNFSILDNPGFLGIAGSNYQSFFPNDWWCPLVEKRFFNYIQSDKNNTFCSVYKCSYNNSFEQVVCLDGVFLACKKEVILDILFDEDIKGFHGYDVSACIRMSIKYKNYFINNILIEHFSLGCHDLVYFNNLINVYRKYKFVLPISFSDKLDLSIEYKGYVQFLNLFFSTSFISIYKKIYLGFYYIVYSLFKFRNLIFSLKLLKYLTIKLRSEI